MADKIGLPLREFMYTIDQIAYLLEMEESYLRSRVIFFEGRSVGVPTKEEMLAVNVARADEKPEWRVAERYFKRWMRFKGFKIYERGYLQ